MGNSHPHVNKSHTLTQEKKPITTSQKDNVTTARDPSATTSATQPPQGAKPPQRVPTAPSGGGAWADVMRGGGEPDCRTVASQLRAEVYSEMSPVERLLL